MSAAVATAPGTSSSGLSLCSYQRHPCSRPRYLNYKHCAQHIVEDDQSPFTSCEYLSRTTGRKCPNPALRPRKQNRLPIFCSEHLRDLIVKEKHQKKKRKLRRKRKNEKSSTEKPCSSKKQKLIEKLYKYSEVNPKTPREQSQQASSESELEDVHRPIRDDWPLETPASIGTDADWDDFDPVNNEVYEPLRYADVLTAEEVVATAQSKLIRLQSLYVEQFKRLFHLLKERRRQYLLDYKQEIKEEKASAGFARNEVEYEEDDEVYALATCGRRTGVEALLRKRQLQKIEQTEGSMHGATSTKSALTQRCTHTSSHARCKLLCLPYTKYCSSHILEDPHQLLYRKCHTLDCPMVVRHLTARPYAIPTSDGNDTKDVYYCILHAPLPPMTFDFPDIMKCGKMEVDVDSIEEKSIEPSRCSDSIESNLDTPSFDRLIASSLDDEAINVVSNSSTQYMSNASEVLPISASPVKRDCNRLDTSSGCTIDKSSEQLVILPVETAHLNVDVSEPNNILNCDPIKGSEKVIEELGVTGSVDTLLPNEADQLANTVCDLKGDPAPCGGVEETIPAKPTVVSENPINMCSAKESSELKSSYLSITNKSSQEIDSSHSNTDEPAESECSHLKISDGPGQQDCVSSGFTEEERSSHPLIAGKNAMDLGNQNSLSTDKEHEKTESSNLLLADKAPLCEEKGTCSSSTHDPVKNEGSHLEIDVKPHEDLERPSSVATLDTPAETESLHHDDDVAKDVLEDVLKSPVRGAMPPYMSQRGERKPSSAEEEMAVVSLLQLCTGNPSDETPSSSAEQD